MNMGREHFRSQALVIDDEAPPLARPGKPRDYLKVLRPDIDLTGYENYSDPDLDRLIRATQRGYSILRQISHTERDGSKPEGYSCIITVFGDPESINRIAAPMSEEERYKQELGVPFLYRDDEEAVRVLRKLGNHGPTGLDGAFCFDLDGELYATERRVAMPLDLGLNGTREEIRKAKGSIGTKHEAAAYASKHGVTSVALSAEVGTVITFAGGKIINTFTYRPARKT